MSPERGLHDPYKLWKSGFGFELLLFSSFTLTIAALTFLTWWIFR